MSGKREILKQLIEENCLLTEGDYLLSTGQRSSFYFDCKRVTLNGHGLSLIAASMLDEIAKLGIRPDAIGGLTIGADPIIAGVIVEAHRRGIALRGSIARKEPKTHGTCKAIENELNEGATFVVVDDVFTTGASTLKACDAFEEHGYKVIGVIGLVDRCQGGIEAIQKRYKKVSALFSAKEFPRLAQPQAQTNGHRTVATA